MSPKKKRAPSLLDQLNTTLRLGNEIINSAPGTVAAIKQILGPQLQPQAGPPTTRLTPWELFGLPDTASREEIADRYKALMKLYHTDHGCPSDAMAKRINEAYSLIKEERGIK